MQVEEIKKLETFEILLSFVQSVHQCATLEQLTTQSKDMVKQVVGLVLPKYHIEYVANDMPQDILNQEEQKQEMTSEQKLTMWLRQFTRELKATTDVIGQDLEILNQRKEEINKLMKGLEKFPKALQAQKPVLDIVQDEIVAIEKQTKKAKTSETDLMASIEKLFQESIKKMKVAEEVVVVPPKRLTHRLTQPYYPITQVQDTLHPEINALNYDNYLIAVRDALTVHPSYNFVLNNGSATQLSSNWQLTEVQIQPAGKSVQKIVTFSSGKYLYGFQLFAKDGSKLYETKYGIDGCKQQETILEDDERILGIKSRKHNSTSHAAHHEDFQFIIGRME